MICALLNVPSALSRLRAGDIGSPSRFLVVVVVLVVSVRAGGPRWIDIEYRYFCAPVGKSIALIFSVCPCAPEKHCKVSRSRPQEH